MRVALLDDYQRVAMQMADWSRLKPRAEVRAFHDYIDGIDALVEALKPFECVMLMRERTKVPRALIERLPNLRLLITAAMWNASVDMDAAAEHGVQVCGTRDLPQPAAELGLGMMLAFARQLAKEDRAVRDGQWQVTVGTTLHGKTLGIVGLGILGSQMAKFGNMLGMRVIAWSENLTSDSARKAGAERVEKDALFSESDVVSIHLKLSPRTRGLIGMAELQRMKPTAFLVNTARGPIVDEPSLLEILKARRIAGAALDVFDIEPLPRDHPFRSLDNVLLVPHLGYVTEENYRLIYGDTLDAIAAFLDGEPIRPLNQPVRRSLDRD